MKSSVKIQDATHCQFCLRSITPSRAVYRTYPCSYREPFTFIVARCRDCLNGLFQVIRHRRLRREKVKFPFVEWGRKLDDCGYCCQLCGKHSEMTIDHITPFSAGGKLAIENLQPLCKACNSSKGGLNRVRKESAKCQYKLHS